MARYVYRCTSCEELSVIDHLSDETILDCPKCDTLASLVKVLTSFTTAHRPNEKRRAGAVTDEFIQDAKNELKKQQKDLKDKR